MLMALRKFTQDPTDGTDRTAGKVANKHKHLKTTKAVLGFRAAALSTINLKRVHVQ